MRRTKRILKRVLSVATASMLTVGLLSMGGTQKSMDAVKAATEQEYDSVSLVNYSTILGRAVDYGILANKYEQQNHTETNFAVKVYEKNRDINNDPDLAGGDPLPFIIGDITGTNAVLRIDKTYNDQAMKFNIETTPEVIDAGKFKFNGSALTNGSSFVFKKSSKETIDKNIDEMIKHISDESKELYAKTTIDIADFESSTTVDMNNYWIDLDDDKYENAVVYIKVPEGTNLDTILKAENGYTDAIKIKKRSSTVVVFNIENESVVLKQFLVYLTDSDKESLIKGTDKEKISSKTDDSGNASLHNEDVDAQIAQKIVWNLNKATDVKINTSAGTILVPNKEAKIDVTGSSAGWLATGGDVVNSTAEWHFIYRDRSSELNTDEEGQMHFAARKAFTDSYTERDEDGKIIENDTILIGEDDYRFDFYETNSRYNTTSSSAHKIEEKGLVAGSKIKFSPISFAEGETRYFVIKEENPGVTTNKITNSTGEIDIKVVVTKENGSLQYTVSSKYYLTAEDKAAGNAYKTNSNIKM